VISHAVLPRETRLMLWREHLQRDDVPVDFSSGFELLRSSADALDRWHAEGGVGRDPQGDFAA